MYSAYLNETTCILDAKHEILLENPVLELADNAAGSFTFTIYQNNPGYKQISLLTSVVTVKWEDEVLFKGRVISAEKDFSKALIVECEGELAYLADSIQRPAEYHELTVYAYVTKLIELHNAQVEEDKRFEVGSITVTDSNDSLYRYTNWESTLEVFNSDLLDSLGGHLRVRYNGTHRYLDYLADYPRLSAQKIEFGENLLTYTENASAIELATVCIPLGARQEESTIDALEERLTIKASNSGKDYLEIPSAVNKYGRIAKTVIWDNVNTTSVLKAKGQKWLQDNQYEDLELSLTAVDLADFGIETDHLRLLDRIHCMSEPHGMDHEFPLTHLSINLLNPKANVYTLGSKIKTFTGSTGKSQKKLQTQLDNSPSKSNVLKQALDNATQLITMVGKDGHVIFSPSVSEPNELYITDYDNLEDAQRCWRWNLNGLGYSSNGIDGPFDLAITMDGTIAGRFIAAGTIGADQINVSYTSTQEKKWQDKLENEYWTATEITTKIQNSADNILLSAEESTLDKLQNYYTKAAIDIQVNGLTSQVSEKIGSDEASSLIEQKARSIRLQAAAISWAAEKSSMTEDGILTCTEANLAGDLNMKKKIGTWNFSARLGEVMTLLEDNEITRGGFEIFVNNPGRDTSSSIVISPAPNRYATTVVGADTSIISATNHLVIEAISKTQSGMEAWYDTYAFIDMKYDAISLGGRDTNSSRFTKCLTTFVGSDGSAGGDLNGLWYLPTRFKNTGNCITDTTTQAPNLWLGSSNTFMSRSSSSSRRYKHDVTDVDDDLDPKALYRLPVRSFTYNDGYLSSGDQNSGKRMIGFIAEEVAEIYPKAAQYNPDGTVEMWNSLIMIPAMMYLIQDQNKRIAEIERRIS